MGEAMAVPDPVEPLVPCDPKPGFAPPPPDDEVPSMRMGDVAAEPSKPARPVKPPKAAPPPRNEPMMGDVYEPPREELMGKIAAPID
jgi:hypothetical protein